MMWQQRASRSVALGLLGLALVNCAGRTATECRDGSDCPAGYFCDKILRACFVMTAPVDAATGVSDAKRDAGDEAGSTDAGLDASASDRPSSRDIWQPWDAALSEGGCRGAEDGGTVCGEDACAPWGGAGPWGGSVRALAVDPGDPQVVYAATTYGGIYRSQDSAETWSKVADINGVSALSVGPKPPYTVLAANNGLHRSEDRGETWAQIALPQGGNAACFARPTAEPATVYLAAGSAGIYRSDDDGLTWDLKLEAGLGNLQDSIAVDDADPRRVYAISWGSFYASDDRGETWSGPSGTSINHSIAVDPATGFLYQGCFEQGLQRSEDLGQTWTVTTLVVPQLRAVSVDPRWSPSAIYAGSDVAGLFRSVDQGRSWEPLFQGLQHHQAGGHIAPSPASRDVVYLGTNGGVYRSLDAGATWQLASTGLSPLSCQDVLTDPEAPARVLAACSGGGVYLSEDGGQTWQPRNTGLQSLSARTRSFSSFRAAQDHIYYSPEAGHLYQSLDRGNTWTRLGSPGRAFSIAVHPSQPGLLLMGGRNSIYRSEDDGQRWRIIGVSEIEGEEIDAVAWHPGLPDLAIAGGSGGTVLRSQDQGLTWTAIAHGLGEGRRNGSIAFDPSDPRVIYLGGDGGPARSEDLGVTWQRVGDSFTSIAPVLAVHPRCPAILFATSYNSWLWASTDRGLTWSRFDDGFSRPSFSALAFSADGALLYAATGEGMRSRWLR